MVRRNKWISLIALMALTIGFLIASLFSINAPTATAKAATTPYYTALFNYTNTKKVSSVGTTSSSVYKSGTSATVASGIKNHLGNNGSFYVRVYGDSYSGSSVLYKDGYVCSTTINIVFESTFSDHTITVTNGSGAQVKKVTGSKTIQLTGLTQGQTYKVAYFGFGLPGPGTTTTTYTLDANFTFKLDLTAPTMTGCSTSMWSVTSNKTVSVHATDALSGIKNIYRKGPDDSEFWVSSTVGTDTIEAGSTPGLYSFYAEDYAGNKSATYYLYFDDRPPVGSIYNTDGTAMTRSHTSKGFYYTATDEGYGVKDYQYKIPGATTWSAYSSGTTIPNTSTNGQYVFRAIDKLGNTSAESTVYLDTVAPTGKIYANSTVLSNGSKTSASSLYYSASDSGGGATCYVKMPDSTEYVEYVNGSPLTESGEYSFYCVDYAGLTSTTYTAFMDNELPILTCNVSEFSETVKTGFTVSATDEHSGATLYYRRPGDSSYTVANDGRVSFNVAQPDGKYYFYAVDGLNNMTETYWIELKVDLPVATIVNSQTDNRIYATWTGTSISATLNGNAYQKGTWISEEGKYVLELTDIVSGRKNSYDLVVEHYYELVETIQPTCTEQGYSVYECISCDSYYYSNYVAANGHSYQTTVHPPSCTAQGYTVYVCTACDYTYTGDYKSALGHSYEREVIPPTCTERGYTVSTCSRCGYSYTSDYVSPLGHSYTAYPFSATCTEKGGVRYVCERCGDEYVLYTESELGHHYYAELVEPTCETKGYLTHICTQCEYSYQTDYKKPLGHSYYTWVSLSPNCTTDGERRNSCDRCGKNTRTVIPCRGHSYTITDTEVDGGTRRHYLCTECGEEYVQYLGDQYTMVSDYVENLFDEFAPYMTVVFLATSGVWSIAMGIAFVIAYRSEDKQKARKMLVNYAIGMIAIFTILVACPYLIRGIAYLVAH